MEDIVTPVKPSFQRDVSPLERIFVLLAKIDTPFSNQMVLEGTGTLDASRWEKAVQAASEANPGSRLVYRGASVWAKWVDAGITPPIRRLDGSGWSGSSSEGADFLFDALPFKQTHSCEVVLLDGNPMRAVFRTLHATMDGGGTLLWVQDIFRALRGEPLVGSSSTITDVEFVSRANYAKKKCKQKPRKCLAPTGRAEGQASGYVWRRMTLRGRFSRILPQAAWLVAQEVRKQGPGHVSFNVPLDLRRRTPEIVSTANLTRRIVLEVPPEATVGTIQEQMMDKLEHLSADPKILKLLGYAPLGWIEFIFKAMRNRNLRGGIYHTTGSFSNLGRLPMESFHGGGFTAETGFFIPPGTEAKPFFMTLSGFGDRVEMVVSMPKSLANNGRLEKFISNIGNGLKSK